MTENFEVDSDDELIILEKMLIEAKFREQPASESHLAGSPIAASLVVRLFEVINERCRASGKDDKLEWRTATFNINQTNHPLLWDFCLRYWKRHYGENGVNPDYWAARTENEKVEFARILFSPYQLDDLSVKNFLGQAEGDQ